MTACGNWKKKKLLNKCTYSLPFFTKLSFKIKSILLYNMGTCGQDPIWCLWLLLPPPHFFCFWTSIFCSCTQHFATYFLCNTGWHIYNKFNQAVVSIHTRFLTYVYKRPGIDRNYCLIVFIVYMSSSDT